MSLVTYDLIEEIIPLNLMWILDKRKWKEVYINGIYKYVDYFSFLMVLEQLSHYI